jgi:hypothetical protein
MAGLWEKFILSNLIWQNVKMVGELCLSERASSTCASSKKITFLVLSRHLAESDKGMDTLLRTS